MDEGFKPINLYQREDEEGNDIIGFEAGMDYEFGVPINMYVEIDNEFEGLKDFKVLEMSTYLKL